MRPVTVLSRLLQMLLWYKISKELLILSSVYFKTTFQQEYIILWA